MGSSLLDVVAIGNAIVDVLAQCDDQHLQKLGLNKGGMQLIDEPTAERLYGQMGSAVECSGGSAANSMAGVASLGGKAGFIGKVRNDDLGKIFAHDIRAIGVEYNTEAAIEGAATARCLILVTPDAQRTMNTFLGVSGSLSTKDLDRSLIERGQILYLEGYLFDQEAAKQAFRDGADIARAAGRKVALSLSDAFCVERHRDDFQALVKGQVDVLFANESEVLALYQTSDFDQAVLQIREAAELAVVTRGEKGSVVISHNSVTEVPAAAIDRLVDTTGAGDLFAAGFMFGLTRQKDLTTCAKIGAVAAAEIISHYGARPETSLEDLALHLL